MLAQVVVNNSRQVVIQLQTINFAAIYIDILAESGSYLRVYINGTLYWAQSKSFNNDFISVKLFPTSNDKIEVETDGRAYVTIHGMIE